MTNCISKQLKKRRAQGAENVKKRDLEDYAKNNPVLKLILKNKIIGNGKKLPFYNSCRCGILRPKVDKRNYVKV